MATQQDTDRQALEAFLQQTSETVKTAQQNVYFSRLEAHGIVPRTEAEAMQLLEMGDNWSKASQLQATKVAAASPNPFGAAAAYLAQQAQVSPAETQMDLTNKVASAMVAANPGLQDAVLSLQALDAHEWLAAQPE